MRDIDECVKELMGNPIFRDHMRYSFSKLFLVDTAGVCHRAYHEIWDSDWMCEVEVRVKEQPGFSLATLMSCSHSATTRSWLYRGLLHTLYRQD
jgi:hypothetical protein